MAWSGGRSARFCIVFRSGKGHGCRSRSGWVKRGIACGNGDVQGFFGNHQIRQRDVVVDELTPDINKSGKRAIVGRRGGFGGECVAYGAWIGKVGVLRNRNPIDIRGRGLSEVIGFDNAQAWLAKVVATSIQRGEGTSAQGGRYASVLQVFLRLSSSAPLPSLLCPAPLPSKSSSLTNPKA